MLSHLLNFVSYNFNLALKELVFKYFVIIMRAHINVLIYDINGNTSKDCIVNGMIKQLIFLLC